MVRAVVNVAGNFQHDKSICIKASCSVSRRAVVYLLQFCLSSCLWSVIRVAHSVCMIMLCRMVVCTCRCTCILSYRAMAGGLAVSLMERLMSLYGSEISVMLTTQYRSSSMLINVVQCFMFRSCIE